MKGSKNGYIRFLVSLLVVASVIFMPWWFTISALIIAILYYNHYYEALIISLMYDALYGAELNRFNDIPLMVTLGTVVFIAITLFIKRRLSIYVR